MQTKMLTETWLILFSLLPICTRFVSWRTTPITSGSFCRFRSAWYWVCNMSVPSVTLNACDFEISFLYSLFKLFLITRKHKHLLLTCHCQMSADIDQIVYLDIVVNSWFQNKLFDLILTFVDMCTKNKVLTFTNRKPTYKNSKFSWITIYN